MHVPEKGPHFPQAPVLQLLRLFWACEDAEMGSGGSCFPCSAQGEPTADLCPPPAGTVR